MCTVYVNLASREKNNSLRLEIESGMVKEGVPNKFILVKIERKR